MKLIGMQKILASCAGVATMAICLACGSTPEQGLDHQEAKQQAAGVVAADRATPQVVTSVDQLPCYPQFAPVEGPEFIQLCQGLEGGGAPVDSGMAVTSGCAGGNCGICDVCQGNTKMLMGVDEQCSPGRESTWKEQRLIPWESFAYGEYIGPYRTPAVGEYQLRVNDVLDFVYLLTRETSVTPYKFYPGDVIQITSAIDASLNQTDIIILSDGTISLPLIGEVHASGKTVAALQADLNEKYSQFVKNPAIVVQVIVSDTPLKDLISSVDATAGTGGQVRQATVTPDGTIQLPLIGSIPAIGLTLDEIRREVNARYGAKLKGVGVTPILVQRAPTFVFVVGAVAIPGRYELVGPTTVIQSLALAQGTRPGGNVRQAIVFRRDANWRLMATRLDISGPLYGRRPHPSDDIWLRDSDIVLIPPKPIQRLSEAVNLYFSRTLYQIFPQSGVSFNFDTFGTL
jgi:polysaccharide export outer membrane protein